MLFNSYAFVLFVLVTFALYYARPLRAVQRWVLIAASLFFYAYGQAQLVLLLLASIGINAVSSYAILRCRTWRARQGWAIAGVVLNLGILIVFKYGRLLAASVGVSPGPFLLNAPLPIGISFFTFQGISLVVDVYRQRPDSPERIGHRDFYAHLVDTALFKSFFPQLVAGPIVKAHDFYPQIGPKRLAEVPWTKAFQALVTGYFLKMVIADNLTELTFPITYPYFANESSLTLAAMLFGYSMQIFADFAGYSLIAIGLARLFGYELIQNFNFPYISQSLAEFWRRWHISLSTWLRDYLYIPLGGNRKGAVRNYFNLLIVMTLGGLWHGASWSYALWGIFHGLGLALERFCQGGRRTPAKQRLRPARMLAVFAFVTLGWLLFKLPKIEHVAGFWRAVAKNVAIADDTRIISFIVIYSAPVILYHLWALCRERGLAIHTERYDWAIHGLCLFAIVLNSGSPGAFIYFQF